VLTKGYNKKYLKYYNVPEWESSLDQELKPYLSDKERQYILNTKNRATQIIATQSEHLKVLNQQGFITDYNYVALENQLKDFYDQ
jgi:putative membrane protein